VITQTWERWALGLIMAASAILAALVSVGHVVAWTLVHSPPGTSWLAGATNATISELLPIEGIVAYRVCHRSGRSVVLPVVLFTLGTGLSLNAQLAMASPGISGAVASAAPMAAVMLITKTAVALLAPRERDTPRRAAVQFADPTPAPPEPVVQMPEPKPIVQMPEPKPPTENGPPEPQAVTRQPQGRPQRASRASSVADQRRQGRISPGKAGRRHPDREDRLGGGCECQHCTPPPTGEPSSEQPRDRGACWSHEIRVRLGDVSRQSAYQITSRADFPKPCLEQARGRPWLAGDVDTWMREHRQGLDDREDG
jgi:prophage regulatory protein